MQAGFASDGTINGIIMEIYGDSGCYNNGVAVTSGMEFLDNGMVMLICNTFTPQIKGILLLQMRCSTV